jgi:hypothetical protein
MSTDSPLNVMAPPVFDGTNYQVWVVRMETYLDANDQWEAIADTYEVPPLLDNPTIAQIKNNKRRVKENQRQKLVYLQLFHLQFLPEL